MKIRSLMMMSVTIIFSVVTFGQNDPKSLDSFVGRWNVDLEKSFSRSERGKLSSYTLTVGVEGDTLTMDWEFTIAGSLSRIREVFSVDTKEHRYRRREIPIPKTLFFDFGHFLNIRAYRAKFDKTKLKITFQQPLSDSMDAYLDQRTYETSADGRSLDIVVVIRSARPGDAAKNQTRRLTLTRIS